MNILQAIIAHTRPDEKRTSRGTEYYIDCPFCGRKRELKRFSFSSRGYHCFSCGGGGKAKSLSWLAKELGVGDREYVPMPRREEPKPEPPPAWMLNPPTYPIAVREWQKYAPLPERIIREKQLGIGALPQSQCKHDRLIVPIFNGGLLVGLRGRAINCRCPKWLAPAGTKIARYTLYNIDAVTPGSVVLIVENPIDALLINLADPGAVGVATYSTSYWQGAWAESLARTKPKMVVVAFDNDLPGNGGALRRGEMIAEWLQTHKRIPKPCGVKLVEKLRGRVPVVLYDWQNAITGADMGSELAKCV